MTRDKVITLVVFMFWFCVVSMHSSNGIYLTSQSEEEKPTVAELEILLETKTIENCEKAINGYQVLLKENPNDYRLLQRIASAYTAMIDIKTSALIVEKDEYKPILKKLGSIANDYAKKAYKLKPNDKEVVGTCLVSYGYYSASFGIVKAIFKGAAGHYKDLAHQLNKIDETYMGGMGYRLLGKLYYVAPWPVGSKKKALKNFLKAVEIDKAVLYSRYYVGLLHFKKKKYDLAEEEFKFVLENDPKAHEKHFIDQYKKSAQDYLDKIKKIKSE
jgi:tetratricopeptide (TPR) repeat protein